MSAVPSPGATRFRLRFLLQEFALPNGDTFIGRSHDCQITIFDPLVSRRHARIQVFGDRAVLEDLGSRNGCKVNGALIQGSHPLTAGDRIRIGKHDLVFSEVSATGPTPRERQTGSLVFCASCDTVYAAEMGMCPSCWSRESVDEETRSGVFNEQGKEAWAVDLLLELFNKALASNGRDEAERAMRQTMAGFEAMLKSGARFPRERLEPLASAAIRLSEMLNDGFWAHWASDFYVRAGVPVPGPLTAAIAHWGGEPKPPEDG